jgi:hypothetical protein
MNNSDIKSALDTAGVKHDRVRKHGDDAFRINKVEDVAAATRVLHALEGAKCDVDGDKITVTFEASTATETAEAPKLDPGTAEGQLALQGNAGSRAKNPGYEEVFDLAVAAIAAGDTLKDWKAGRRVRMMQTIRKVYADQFEQRGRNVVFTGDVSSIDKAKVLSQLGLKTNRSLPVKATEAAAA